MICVCAECIDSWLCIPRSSRLHSSNADGLEISADFCCCKPLDPNAKGSAGAGAHACVAVLSL